MIWLSPSFLPVGKMVLTGGRAPVSWSRAMSSYGTWLQDWSVQASWIRPLVALRPTLRQGPPMGTALASLSATPDAGRAADRATEGGRSERKPLAPSGAGREKEKFAGRFAESSGPRPGAKGWRRPAGPGHRPDYSERPATAAAELPERAARALLEMLAGHAARTHAKRSGSGHAPAMAMTGKRGEPLPATDDTAGRRDWLYAVAQRSLQPLYSTAREQFVETIKPPQKRSSPPSPVPTHSPSWSTGVSGQRAPRETLARLLATPPDSDTDSASENFSKPFSNGRRPLAGTTSPGEPAGAENRGRAVQRARPPFVPSSTTPQVLPANDAAQSRAHDEEESRVRPPSAIPVRPTLRIPTTRGESPSRPASTMILHEAAKEVEGSEQDALIDLSEKMRRILNEEARRFGIDV